jgi:hypothetical protein
MNMALLVLWCYQLSAADTLENLISPSSTATNKHENFYFQVPADYYCDYWGFL